MNCSKCGGRMKIGTAKDVGSPDGIDMYLSYGRCRDCDTIEFFKKIIVSRCVAKEKPLTFSGTIEFECAKDDRVKEVMDRWIEKITIKRYEEENDFGKAFLTFTEGNPAREFLFYDETTPYDHDATMKWFAKRKSDIGGKK